MSSNVISVRSFSYYPVFYICRLLFPNRDSKEQKQLALELLEAAEVHPTQRAQELSVEQFGKVANKYREYLDSCSLAAKGMKI